MNKLILLIGWKVLFTAVYHMDLSDERYLYPEDLCVKDGLAAGSSPLMRLLLALSLKE